MGWVQTYHYACLCIFSETSQGVARSETLINLIAHQIVMKWKHCKNTTYAVFSCSSININYLTAFSVTIINSIRTTSSHDTDGSGSAEAAGGEGWLS